MNLYEPCLFSKFAVGEEPAVDGGTIAPGGFVGCDQLMGRHIMTAWKDCGEGSNLENGTGCWRTGRPISEDANAHGGLIGASSLT